MAYELPDTKDIPDLGIVARTLWGEFRGGGYLGMQSVACVILNRAKSNIRWWGGPDLRSICLAPWQFSCWLKNDPNRAKMIAVSKDDASYRIALEIAGLALEDKLPDITNGAMQYFNHNMPSGSWPDWAVNGTPCYRLNPHWFYLYTQK